MRKQFKIKKRSCALCKPHKRGRDCRWRPRERQAQRELLRLRQLPEGQLPES